MRRSLADYSSNLSVELGRHLGADTITEWMEQNVAPIRNMHNCVKNVYTSHTGSLVILT